MQKYHLPQCRPSYGLNECSEIALMEQERQEPFISRCKAVHSSKKQKCKAGFRLELHRPFAIDQKLLIFAEQWHNYILSSQ